MLYVNKKVGNIKFLCGKRKKQYLIHFITFIKLLLKAIVFPRERNLMLTDFTNFQSFKTGENVLSSRKF